MLLNRVDSGREGGKVSLRFLTPSFVGDSTFKKKKEKHKVPVPGCTLDSHHFLNPESTPACSIMC